MSDNNKFTKDIFVVDYAGRYDIQTTPVYGSPSILDSEAVGIETASAYAHLFEAAPDMYKALQSSLQILEQTLVYRNANNLTIGTVFLEVAISESRDAIRKATNKTLFK